MNKISDLKVGDKVALMNGQIDTFTGKRLGCGAARLEKYHHVHNDRIDWQKTNKLNNNQMNKISDLKVGDQVVLLNGGKIDTVTKLTFCGGANLAKSKHIHDSNVNWKKTNELNKKQMEFKIEVPEGYQIDKEKSTFEKIVFKEIENKLPMSVEEIPNRKFYITNDSNIVINNNKRVLSTSRSWINQLSTKERAEAFLALMQLVELRDAWNGDSERHLYLIYNENRTSNLLSFKTLELRNQFGEQFKDLIETAKELL